MFNAQNRIRQLMAERGWTIYRLAQESGLSQTTISNIFKRNNQPSLPTVNAICDACGITLAQFFTENDTANSPNAKSELDNSVAAHSRGCPSYIGQSLYFFTNQRRRIHEQRNHAGKHTIC